jgi:thiol-disulfide isomerase/thioredoxin
MKLKLTVALAMGVVTSMSMAQEIVKIGHVAPLSGAIAHLGKDNEYGARLAIEELNAKGVSIGGKKVNLDEGKKLVCFFAPGCDHCRETAKELKALAAKMKLPDTYIIFMDEESFLIPEFLKETGFNKPYQVIDIPKFWTVLGSNASTPGLFYLWNGNIIKSFEGIEGNKFDAAALKSAIEQPYVAK